MFLPLSTNMPQNGDGRLPLSDLTAKESAQVLAIIIATRKSAGEREELLARAVESAVCVGNVGLLKKLLKLGASANTRCSDGDSLLHMAAGAGNQLAVRALLEHGAKVHACGSGQDSRTALHLAAMNENPRTVAALLEAGAQINFRPTEEDVTALDLAAVSGSVAVIEVFRQHGADFRTRNWDGYTALHAAASEDQVGAIETLILGGADPNARDGAGSTPLHMAMSNNNHASVRALCALRADMNRPDATGRTPLHFGIVAPGSLYAVNELLDAGADANLRQCCNHDDSPLDMAAWLGKLEIMRALLEHGAVSTAVDSFGQSALHKASCRNEAGAIDALIGAGASVNAQDVDERTPLHLASYVLAAEAAEVLLNHGADVDATDKWGQTPLHLAASVSEDDNSARFVALLLERDADEKAVDDGGRTPGKMLERFEEGENGELVEDPLNNALVRDQLIWMPKERAWRRRGFFVMCRARLSRGQPILPDQDAAPRRAKVARVEGRVVEGGGDAAGYAGGQGIAHRGAAGGASAVDNDDEGVVAKCVGDADCGVFRNVMKFL